MDLTTTRYRTFEELSLYCYRVASIVGLICLHARSIRSPLFSWPLSKVCWLIYFVF